MAALLLCLALSVAAICLAVNAAALLGHRVALSEGRARERLGAALIVRGFLAEWLATTFAVLLWPFGLFSPPSRLTGATRGVAVLIPEVGGNRSSFWMLRRRLRKSGWQTVDASARRWWRRPELGRVDLDARIRRSSEAVPGAPLVLVGHGAGGLAARDYLRATPGAAPCQLVTLGTPHQGSVSSIYRLFSRELEPAARRMQDLRDADGVPERLEVVTISSRFDAWIVPPEAAYYPGAFNIEVSAVGHFRLLTSRRVWELIAENLATSAQERK